MKTPLVQGIHPQRIDHAVERAQSQIQERANLQYIWKCQQELQQFADAALDQQAGQIAAAGTRVETLAVADKPGIFTKLKCRKVTSLCCARLEALSYTYQLTPERLKKVGQYIEPVVREEAPMLYIDEEKRTYLRCALKSELKKVPARLFVQVDRDTAIGFLLKAAQVSLQEDPKQPEEQTRKLLEEAKKTVQAYLSHMLSVQKNA